VPWQRCQFHLQQNAQAYVPRKDRQAEAEAHLRQTVDKDAQASPRLATWLEENLPEGLTVFAFPQAHRRLIRTTNGLERLNREIGRRTRVVGIFPNEAACLRLFSAILMEISDDWETGRTYLKFSSS
jgi:putative transposase